MGREQEKQVTIVPLVTSHQDIISWEVTAGEIINAGGTKKHARLYSTLA